MEAKGINISERNFNKKNWRLAELVLRKGPHGLLSVKRRWVLRSQSFFYNQELDSNKNLNRAVSYQSIL